MPPFDICTYQCHSEQFLHMCVLYSPPWKQNEQNSKFNRRKEFSQNSTATHIMAHTLFTQITNIRINSCLQFSAHSETKTNRQEPLVFTIWAVLISAKSIWKLNQHVSVAIVKSGLWCLWFHLKFLSDRFSLSTHICQLCARVCVWIWLFRQSYMYMQKYCI